MADKKVGKIIHYYNKISVAIIELSDNLSVGDVIKITGHEKEFNQTISSIQIEHENINKAKKGQVIGVKVDQLVKKGDEVFKVKS